ncbi:AAA family ATPase [Herbiconiux sp. CPCC 203407]|uniref:AAA family ATPase n=1 Tax=Herbiconiux oxytropis TaxID=2970915 RepID=A0AA41XJX1_9MICO|nr:AAA family ATPase [Herbiconiux oxytropis]MCS5722504.1 AAA family ATPase [Herbiconiux oxytropis]MCS5727563.1 AAA family ATPase [Herbiconiux oxytropis]
MNGGFLAGLDVELSRGLNVVIGPRGSGKTTLLELIRHALGIEHADEAEAKRQRKAITHLLGAGEVVLDVEDEHSSYHLVVDAQGNGRSGELSTAALALGQNELERIASNSASRLNLIDLRAVVSAAPPSLELAGRLTRDLARVRQDAEQAREQASRRALLEADRTALADQERELLIDSSADLGERRELLRALEAELLAVSGHAEASERTTSRIADAFALAQRLQAAIGAVPSRENGVAVAAEVEPRVSSLLRLGEELVSGISELESALNLVRRDLLDEQNRLRLKAAPVRAELETAERGLGQITARLRNIDAELAEVARLEAALLELQASASELVSERSQLLDEYENWQEGLFEARRAVAQAVSEDLESRVVVSVDHLADSTKFRDLLIELLQGSGLQYRALADSMARSLLPRQLLSYVENNDLVGLSEATNVGTDRATRVLAALQNEESVSSLAEATLDDRVDFRLIDGAIQKSVEDLSTGQKCAVTLPIVLTEGSRILILDQPEDHLDNAYLVKNIITSLMMREERGAQTVVATHNANIPVLASAEVVLSLESDGTRGFVVNRGSFESQPIVDTITGLMEGGRDAFLRRAEFYAEHEVESN